MADTPEEFAKHRKAYWAVFIALCAFTVFTVALAKLHIFDFGAPGVTGEDMVIGLLVAVIKAALVALIFMHLNHERGLIYKMLLFTAIFAFGLMVLTLLAWADPIHQVLWPTD